MKSSQNFGGIKGRVEGGRGGTVTKRLRSGLGSCGGVGSGGARPGGGGSGSGSGWVT